MGNIFIMAALQQLIVQLSIGVYDHSVPAGDPQTVDFEGICMDLVTLFPDYLQMKKTKQRG